MALPLASELRFGFMTSVPDPDTARATAERAEAWGYDSLWNGDHVAFTVPILDPLLQLAQLGAFTRKLTLGTAVYLLPLRHPVPVAKQVATLDRLVGGRLVFGVGVGGEFPAEYAACGVPLRERGARIEEAIPLLRQLWSGESVAHAGRFYPIPPTRMLPKPLQPGGPPLWGGGRSPAALARLGRLADGWISYVVTPERYAESLGTIARAAQGAGRALASFGTGHLLFAVIDDSYERAWDAATEHLSRRYASDFRAAAKKYAALGKPADVAERVAAFVEAGVRHLVIDPVGRLEERDIQLERFAQEVRPLLGAAASA
jgi:probable F420-dependent oxidoreductase